MNKLLTLIIIISSSILLTGCGSKNNSSGVAGTTFTDWKSLQSNQVINGISVDITSPDEDTAPTNNGFDTEATAVIDTGDVDTGFTKISYTSNDNKTVFDVSDTGTSASDNITVDGESYGYYTFTSDGDESPILITGIPQTTEGVWKYEYQNYGAWVNFSMDGLSIGAMSAGAETPYSGLPENGSATYVGEYTGVYINDATNEDAITVGKVALDANFTSRNIVFGTYDNYKKNLWQTPELNFVGASHLNISGTLNFADETNLFSGSVTLDSDTGEVEDGVVKGQFYGPEAQEVGGVFDISHTSAGDTELHIGSFGAIIQATP